MFTLTYNMQDITFNNWQTFYTVPDEVSDQIALMQRRINQLEDAIRQAKLKAETAKEKPTKLLKLEAHYARQYLYTLVGDKVKQLELL